MRRLFLSLAIAASASVAGCGGSQPPIGGPGAMPQATASATHADRGTSWIEPAAGNGSLLYVARPEDRQVDVYSYPKGKKAGSLSVSARPWSLCSDRRGNIWVTMDGLISEYSHGGTQPIGTLKDSGFYAYACALNSKTGDLAVANTDGPSTEYGNLLVYKNASGSPLVYTNPQFMRYNGCAYDDSGNLYVVGSSASGAFAFAELTARGTKLKTVALSHTPQGAADIRWDGRYVAISSPDEGLILRFTFKANYGEEAGFTSLNDFQNVAQFSFPVPPDQKHKTAFRVIGPDWQYGATRIWRYPAGGDRIKQIPGENQAAFGSTVSFALQQI